MNSTCLEPQSRTHRATAVATLTGIAGPLRVREPVSVGVPWAAGQLWPGDSLQAHDGPGSNLPTQWESLSNWPDGSVRWALVDLLLDVAAGKAPTVHVERTPRATAVPNISVERDRDGHTVSTGAASFHLPAEGLRLIYRRPGARMTATPEVTCALETQAGERVTPRRRRLQIETTGPVRTTLRLETVLELPRSRRRLELDARISFFAGTSLLKLDLTLRNPHAAAHPGGCWDLGDPGSILFRDFAVAVTCDRSPAQRLRWTIEPEAPVHEASGVDLEIYQASSGGHQWRSANHVDRDGTVPLPFRGYRVRVGSTEDGGLRATPIVAATGRDWQAVVALPRFWQEFPKAIESQGNGLQVRLFPRQHSAGHELQGGEQKSHTMFLLLNDGTADGELEDLAWVARPLRLSLLPREVAATSALRHFVPAAEDPHGVTQAMASCVVEGERSFLQRRESIDEYGWRNFGDVYADHENRHYQGPGPVVSHYNNQYDLVGGLLLQSLRTGDSLWSELADDLARHVVDIDVYHTLEDKPAYCGGLFWHTDHYSDAARATHRTYSRLHPRAASGQPYGGGPSCEHNYTSGLLLHYYLTGEPRSREAVLCLADWVLRMDDGALTLLGAIDPGPTGQASSTHEPTYHGPGRGAGNSINALLDAFALTRHGRYLDKAEELVQRCIHPADDPSRRRFTDLEARWSYLVFLQTLGKYLDLKEELGQRDQRHAYARVSLISHSIWMHDNERPYRDCLDQVEYPTETWPAHDLRKSVIFDLAAERAPPGWRARFSAKAAEYYAAAVDGMRSFDTWSDTRPLAILLQNLGPRGYYATRAVLPPEEPLPQGEWGPAREFVPQVDRVRRMLRCPAGLWNVARRLASPARALQLARALFRELRARRRS